MRDLIEGRRAPEDASEHPMSARLEAQCLRVVAAFDAAADRLWGKGNLDREITQMNTPSSLKAFKGQRS